MKFGRNDVSCLVFNLQVESAYSVIVSWDPIHPKSGLDVTYLLFQGNKFISQKVAKHDSQQKMVEAIFRICFGQDCNLCPPFRLVYGQVAQNSSRLKSCCPKPESCCLKFIVMLPEILSHVARNFIKCLNLKESLILSKLQGINL